MTFNSILKDWLHDNSFGSIINHESISGGCINQCYRLDCNSGYNFFLKTHKSPPADFYHAEAKGLNALANTQTLKIPKVYHFHSDYLLLEFLKPAAKSPHYWQLLGQKLANMHTQTVKSFGFIDNNYCGITPQPNPHYANGFRFFAEQRLLYQSKMTRDKGLLNEQDYTAIESICHRLEELIPPQAPCLLHGDLWSGNIHTGPAGEPVLIDPACYWGWAEAELAMTRLFGGFTQHFYDSYLEINPFEQGFEKRVDLYNLYHMLNHLNIFGGSYYQSVKNIVDMYT